MTRKARTTEPEARFCAKANIVTDTKTGVRYTLQSESAAWLASARAEVAAALAEDFTWAFAR